MTTCQHCGRPIEQDDAPNGPWFHPDTMSTRCDGPDDHGACIITAENIGTEDDCTTHDHEPLFWSDMVRQAEPGEEVMPSD